MECQTSNDRGSAKTSFAEDPPLDPRINVELERLNQSNCQINKLELELEETNEQFRVLLSTQAGGLEKLMRKLGTTIEKARPYYEAKLLADDLQKKLLEAAVKFQRANDIHKSARKSVQQAESRYNASVKESHFDGSCLMEQLNNLTMQVMEAEKQKAASETLHRSVSERFFEAEKKVHDLERLLHREIEKSRTYFNMKNCLNSQLNALKSRIIEVQHGIAEAKRAYSHSMSNLEIISESIHQKNGTRVPGEGAEEKEEEQTKKQHDE